MSTAQALPPTLVYKSLPTRGLTAETCKRWGYKVDETTGDHYAKYPSKDGGPDAYKVRTPKKDFRWIGKLDKAQPLFGQHLWPPGCAKTVTITEGEADCMALSQAQSHKWPVVSIPNGATSAAKDITAALPWLSTFERIVLMFDSDAPGQRAAEAVALILPPGKAYIAKLTGAKDANDMLLQGRSDELISAVFRAGRHIPGGVARLEDGFDDLDAPAVGIPWSHPWLTDWTYGRRYGEVYGFGAGTGVGKSMFLLQEMAFTIGPGCKESAAIFSFENSPRVTRLQLLGKLVGKQLHIPDPEHALHTPEDLARAKALYTEQCAPCFVNDARGTADWDDIVPAIRMLAHSEGVKHFVIDNLTALVDPASEREDLERIMASIAGLAEELHCCMYYVSHLTTPETSSHEEGARVTIRSFKGSRAIGFWSHFMFGLERNQQADSEGERAVTVFRGLKDRFSGGSVGKTQTLVYDHATGMSATSEHASFNEAQTDQALTEAIANMDLEAFNNAAP